MFLFLFRILPRQIWSTGSWEDCPKVQESNNNDSKMKAGTTKVFRLHSAKAVKKAHHFSEKNLQLMKKEAQHFLI